MKKICFFLFISLVVLPAMVFSQVTIAGNTNLSTAGNVQLVLSDMDLVNNGNTDLTNSTVHFTGIANSSLSTPSGFMDINNLTINKQMGKLLTLNSSLFLSGQVNFISGNIDLKDKTIYLDSTGFFNGESETSRALSSTGAGLITAHKTLNAPNAVNLGNLGATITSAWNMGSVTVTRAHYSIDVSGVGGKSILRSFEFINSLPSNNPVLLNFKYFDAELNAVNENNLMLFQTPDNSHYANRSFLSRDPVNNSLTQNVSNMLSKFTLSDDIGAGPLPVTLSGFTAQCKGSFVQLNWKTASELNSDRFNIERSFNGTAWQKIGMIKSAGNSNSFQYYHYNDSSLNVPDAFYRLAQYDLDGKIAYSSVVKAGCGRTSTFTIMPNPVADIAGLLISGEKNQQALLELFNAAGQEVLKQSIQITNGINQYSLNMSAMPAGTYELRLTQKGEPGKTAKIIKR